METLLTLAMALGLEQIVDGIHEAQASGKGMSPDQILKATNEILNKVRQGGYDKASKISSQLNKLQNELNHLPYNVGIGKAKQVVQQAIKANKREVQRLTSMSDDINARINKNEGLISDIQTRANTLANQSASFRKSSTGKADYDKIIEDANSIITNNQDLVKEIETSV